MWASLGGESDPKIAFFHDISVILEAGDTMNTFGPQNTLGVSKK